MASVSAGCLVAIGESRSIHEKCEYKDSTELSLAAMKTFEHEMIENPLDVFSEENYSHDGSPRMKKKFKQIKTKHKQYCEKVYPIVKTETEALVRARDCIENAKYDQIIDQLQYRTLISDYTCGNRQKNFGFIMVQGRKCMSKNSLEIKKCSRSSDERVKNIPVTSSNEYRSCMENRSLREWMECAHRVYDTCKNRVMAKMTHYILERFPKLSNCSEITNLV